jgi:hypothetical protein
MSLLLSIDVFWNITLCLWEGGFQHHKTHPMTQHHITEDPNPSSLLHSLRPITYSYPRRDESSPLLTILLL